VVEHQPSKRALNLKKRNRQSNNHIQVTEKISCGAEKKGGKEANEDSADMQDYGGHPPAIHLLLWQVQRIIK
jgi:hypothetical protein